MFIRSAIRQHIRKTCSLSSGTSKTIGRMRVRAEQLLGSCTAAKIIQHTYCCLPLLFVFLRACGQRVVFISRTSKRARYHARHFRKVPAHVQTQQHVHYEQHVISHPCGSRSYRYRLGCASKCLIFSGSKTTATACTTSSIFQLKSDNCQRTLNMSAYMHYSRAQCATYTLITVNGACYMFLRCQHLWRTSHKTMWSNDCGRRFGMMNFVFGFGATTIFCCVDEWVPGI